MNKTSDSKVDAENKRRPNSMYRKLEQDNDIKRETFIETKKNFREVLLFILK